MGPIKRHIFHYELQIIVELQIIWIKNHLSLNLKNIDSELLWTGVQFDQLQGVETL